MIKSKTELIKALSNKDTKDKYYSTDFSYTNIVEIYSYLYDNSIELFLFKKNKNKQNILKNYLKERIKLHSRFSIENDLIIFIRHKLMSENNSQIIINYKEIDGMLLGSDLKTKDMKFFIFAKVLLKNVKEITVPTYSLSDMLERIIFCGESVKSEIWVKNSPPGVNNNILFFC